MAGRLSEEREQILKAATIERKDNEITVVCIKNPYAPENSQIVENIKSVSTLGEVVTKYYPLMSPDFDIAVAIDGISYQGELKDLKNKKVVDISSITFCAVPHGGGGGGKNILGMLAMVVVMVVAWYAAPAIIAGMGITGAAAGVATSVAAAAIIAVGGMLVNALLPPPAMDMGGTGDYSGSLTDSPTYGFDAQPNPTTNGLVAPVLYGAYRVTPPILNQFITPGAENNQQYNGLYGLGIHTVDDIEDVYINGEPVSYYKGVSLSRRRGSPDQPVIGAFGDTRAERNISRKLDTEWETVRTKGKNIQGLFVGVQAPRILKTTPEGKVEQITVPLEVEYRKVGDSAWKPFPTVVQGGTVETITVDKTRTIFSAGYYRSY